MFRPSPLLAVALSTLILTAMAHADAPDPKAAIVARQQGFKTMGAAMKAMKAQLASDVPDKAAMATAATTIRDTAPLQGALFPSGSGAEAGLKTDALPAIWTDKAKFDGDMAALVTEAGKLVVTVQGGDKDAIAAQVKAVGGTCAACHHQFRQDT